MSTLFEQKTQLRQILRRVRRELSRETQHAHAHALCQQLMALPEINRATHIAVYLAHDGEINLQPFIEYAWQHGKCIYLPVLHQTRLLQFTRYESGAVLQKNKYGIDETIANEVISLETLEVVLSPVVGFDREGHRLGMGSGYYDATFRGSEDTTLIGIAHACQERDAIPVETHDVTLDIITTEKEVIYPAKLLC